MKRILIVLLSLAMILSAALPAVAEAETVLSWEGFEVQPLYYNIRQREAGDSALRIYMRVINNTGYDIYFRIDGCWINDVPVDGSGILSCYAGVDTGPDSEKYCLFQSLDGGDDCIRNPRTVKMKIALNDKNGHKDLYHETVTLDLTGLPGDLRVMPTVAPTPAPSYRTLSKGCKGEDVRQLQVKLIELGYLNDVADGVYGSNTAAAVKALNEANGLDGGATATWETQDMVFQGLANPYREPWIPLQIGANFKWELIVDSTFFFRVEVTNVSRSRAIKGFELSCYQTDLWGEQIGGKELVYFMDNRVVVNPGKTVYSSNFNLGSFYSTDTVWVGVSKIVFMDGEIRELARDEITYYSCLIR